MYWRSGRYNSYNLYWLTWFCNKNKKSRTDDVALRPTDYFVQTMETTTRRSSWSRTTPYYDNRFGIVDEIGRHRRRRQKHDTVIKSLCVMGYAAFAWLLCDLHMTIFITCIRTQHDWVNNLNVLQECVFSNVQSGSSSVSYLMFNIVYWYLVHSCFHTCRYPLTYTMCSIDAQDK